MYEGLVLLLGVDYPHLRTTRTPIHYRSDPVQTTKTSVHGAINMLGLAKRVKARILQASTSDVYGNTDVHPQTELKQIHQRNRNMRFLLAAQADPAPPNASLRASSWQTPFQSNPPSAIGSFAFSFPLWPLVFP
jgi:hypothetical protein